MKPWPHQEQLAKEGVEIIKKYAAVYLATEERTGKTLTAILIAEQLSVSNVLVVTKKAALSGWTETLSKLTTKKKFHVTNYHQLAKVTASYDLVILDEAHNYISSFPKRSKTWCEVKKHAHEKPIIYLSATPYAQGPALLYHQLALSSWSPWRHYSTYYTWHKSFGIPSSIWLNSREVRKYDKVRGPDVLACCEHLFLTKTRKDLGFEHEPEDILHYISLDESTKAIYNTIVKDKYYEGEGFELLCDSVMKLRTSLHMLEGGVAKDSDKYIQLGNNEKIDYIKEKWGDSDDAVIMYQYIAEGDKLRAAFSRAEILQATSYAEGVDLSHKKNLIIYSQDFSTARHTQRRARQANLNREHPINVHFLLTKGGISEQVYKAVSVNKRNYIDSLYEGAEV